MVKKALIFLFLLTSFSIIHLVSAISINVNDNYSPGQTVIIIVDGNIITPIKHSDVLLLKDRDSIQTDYDITKIDDSYVLYEVMPLVEGNYTVTINNVHYFEAGMEKRSNLTANFSIVGEVAPFSVTPGFIITSKDFSIKAKNLGSSLTLSTEFGSDKQSISLGSGRVKEIKFSISAVPSSGTYSLKISSSNMTYDLPIVVLKNETATSQQNISVPFRLAPSDLKMTIIRGAQKSINLTLENLGSAIIERVEFSYSQDLAGIITLNDLIAENISGFAVRNIPVTINVPNRADDFEGFITAFSNNFSSRTKVFISSVNRLNDTPTSIDNTSFSNLQSCVLLGGRVCFQDQLCQGNYTNSEEGVCCLSECVSSGSSGGEGGGSKLIIILVVIVVLIAGFYLYKKYKAPPASPEKKLAEATKKFDSGFKPNNP